MKSPIGPIMFTALVAGGLDGLSAVVFLAKGNFSAVWKLVASGWFGHSAFAHGNEMVIYGLLFHFLIALTWTIVYYLLLRKVNFFEKNVLIGGLIYGTAIWAVMNLIVLPFTNIPQIPHTAIGIVKGLVIIMLCVGMPIAYLIQKKTD